MRLWMVRVPFIWSLTTTRECNTKFFARTGLHCKSSETEVRLLRRQVPLATATHVEDTHV
jgi:hypothetical protein